MKNVQTVTDLGQILGVQIVTLNKTKFLNLLVGVNEDDIYSVAIPDVMVKKMKKEDVKDGEGRVRRSGLSQATEESETISAEGEADPGSDESQDQGTEAQQETS